MRILCDFDVGVGRLCFEKKFKKEKKRENLKTILFSFGDHMCSYD